MTREKYESLPLTVLKELAKTRKMKGVSALRKEALIERMLQEDAKEDTASQAENPMLQEAKVKEKEPVFAQNAKEREAEPERSGEIR